MATAPVSLASAGTQVLTPFAISDTLHTATVSIPKWTATNLSVSFLFELSFNGGGVWTGLGSTPAMPGNSVTTRNTAFGVTLGPLPLLCSVCGIDYLPGDSRYDRALSHSVVALKAGRSLAEFRARLAVPNRTRVVADYKLRVAVSEDGRDIDDQYLDRTYHSPTPTLPANRLLRVSVTANRALSTTLTVTSI